MPWNPMIYWIIYGTKFIIPVFVTNGIFEWEFPNHF